MQTLPLWPQKGGGNKVHFGLADWQRGSLRAADRAADDQRLVRDEYAGCGSHDLSQRLPPRLSQPHDYPLDRLRLRRKARRSGRLRPGRPWQRQ